jgi:hypothetical protein
MSPYQWSTNEPRLYLLSLIGHVGTAMLLDVLDLPVRLECDLFLGTFVSMCNLKSTLPR